MATAKNAVKTVGKAAAKTDFEARYKGLNPEQRQAVDALEGPVMVIAGPGTGKTTVLTLRIANILRHAAEGKLPHKTKPERILALTFTESGAVEMRRKLGDLVGQDAYKVEISTFHGFANRIIQDYPDHFPEIVGASPITEIDQVDIVRRLLNTSSLKLAKLRPFGEPYFYLRDIIRAVTELKQQSVSPEMFAKIAEEDRERFYANPDLIHTSGKYEGKMKGKYDSGAKKIEKNLELVRVYEHYQAELRKAKQYDYADMIMFTALALEADGDLRRALQSTYDYFLVDEHQDTNDAQNKIVELLVGGEGGERDEKPNLFVVGDEKQAIFRFQGASLENFHYFRTRYKDVKLITLRSNYRSTQAILNAAQAVSPRETELKAEAGYKESPANFAVLSTPDVETFFITERIKELLKEKSTEGGPVALEEIAVLYRDNKDAAPLARMLERLHVPFNIESDQDVLGENEIRKLVRVLRAVQHFGSDIWLAEALHADFLGIAPMDAYRIMAFAGRMRRAAAGSGTPGRKMTIFDVLASAELQKEAGVVSKESVGSATKFAQGLQEWKRAAENEGAVEAFEKIVRDSGFLAAVLRHPSGSEKLAKLHALFDLLKSFTERQRNYSLKDFFAYLDLMEEHGVAVKAKDTVRMPGRVRLMTAHKSKGLEFDYVFIMGAVDRKWGSRWRRESLALPKGIYRSVKEAEEEIAENVDGDEEGEGAGGKDDSDERNVFYVALTRARKEVYVTMAKADREGKEQLPTQFISEMKPEILQTIDTAPYEKDFEKRRAEVEFGQTAEGDGGAKEKRPELMEKEFLNALFDAQGLSVTALNNYLECPWHYFYVNLLRIPEAPNKYSSFGNAVHGALKAYFDELERGEDMGKEWLVRRFEEQIAREPIPEHEYEEVLAKGRKALPVFYDAHHADWLAFRNGGGHAMNEVRVDGVTAGEGKHAVPINGKLDRIEVLRAGENIVHVIDYKTGRPKSRNEIEGNTKTADGNYKRQLAFYKLLLAKQGTYDMTEGVIQFVEQDERGKSHREAFEITKGEVAVLEKLVADVAGEIRDLAFWNKGCHEPDCGYCKLREGMG